MTKLAAFFLCLFSLVTLGVWIPSDVETGLIETSRYATNIGDALYPSFIAILLCFLSVALLMQEYLIKQSTDENVPNDDKSYELFYTIFTIFTILLISMLLIVSAGNVLTKITNIIGITDNTYRQLSATAPYKYTGISLGGFFLVFSLISWVQQEITLRAAGIAAGMVLILIFAYDVPFDTLLLPPNGGQ